MLSKEDNEFACRVGPGTAMGELFRRFWLPAMLSDELPGADGPPVRLRLLGEDLVAFRDSNGEVGVVEAHCPHRGASLYFGRNEECGIRCVYHGWKFDVAGNCVDMPSEPAESNFKEKIHITAYPTAGVGQFDLGLHGAASTGRPSSRRSSGRSSRTAIEWPRSGSRRPTICRATRGTSTAPTPRSSTPSWTRTRPSTSPSMQTRRRWTGRPRSW